MKIGAAILFVATTSMLAQQPYHPEVPKSWDASALAALEAGRSTRPRRTPTPRRRIAEATRTSARFSTSGARTALATW